MWKWIAKGNSVCFFRISCLVALAFFWRRFLPTDVSRPWKKEKNRKASKEMRPFRSSTLNSDQIVQFLSKRRKKECQVMALSRSRIRVSKYVQRVRMWEKSELRRAPNLANWIIAIVGPRRVWDPLSTRESLAMETSQKRHESPLITAIGSVGGFRGCVSCKLSRGCAPSRRKSFYVGSDGNGPWLQVVVIPCEAQNCNRHRHFHLHHRLQ